MNRRGAVACALLLGCATTTTRPFPDVAPLWVDPDREPFRPRPHESYVPPRWDSIDHTIFRPLAEAWRFERPREAVNVNAVDEVPSSSWFTNRVHATPIERLTQGACADDPPPPPPWRIIRKKSAGRRPGFVIRGADDAVYFVRTDEEGQAERSTAADAIATRIVWAAGYETPCDHVAFFRPDDLILAPEDEEDPPTDADVQRVLEHAVRREDGRRRVSVSRAIEGRPIGPWQFYGLREDDPNDIVPHEHRRDVRGLGVLVAWLDHFDIRAENGLDAWVEGSDGRGYVQHYMLDVSDSFGMAWPASALMTQRFGHSNYFDTQHVLEDLLSLGMIARPFYREDDRRERIFGYYDVEGFDVDAWRPNYPNPAFERATERDRAWMARILAGFSRELVEAIVATGSLSRPRDARRLVELVMGRRDRILERLLTRLSPLRDPLVEAGALCLTDAAVEGGIRRPSERVYEASAHRGWPAERVPDAHVDAVEGRVCVRLPLETTGPPYWIVDVVAATPGRERTRPARVHLYATGGGVRVVGLERPYTADSP